VVPELAGGTLITLWRNFIRHAFGYGAILVVVATGVGGLLVFRMRSQQLGSSHNSLDAPDAGIRWARIITLEMAAFFALALLSIIGGRVLERAELGLDGGFVGWGLAELISMGLGSFGLTANLWAGLLLGFIILVCLIYGLGLASPIFTGLQRIASPRLSIPLESEPAVSVAPATTQSGAALQGLDKKKRRPYVPPEYRKRLASPGEHCQTIAPPRMSISHHWSCW
jgi:S-DNA-T family DNA segregation ATPase FtsK/SpoIIIE